MEVFYLDKVQQGDQLPLESPAKCRQVSPAILDWLKLLKFELS